MPVSKDPKDLPDEEVAAADSSVIPISENSKKKLYDQKIFLNWCKACGICIAFCPKKVYERGKDRKPVVVHPDACIGCLFCELHCPDFAISIEERLKFKRRKTDV